MTTCAFGCGRKANFTQKNGKEICESSASKCPALKIKNTSNTGKIFTAEHKQKLSTANIETKSKQTIIPWNKGITKDQHPGMMAVSIAQKNLAIEQLAKLIPTDDPAYLNFRQYRTRIVSRSNSTYRVNKDILNPEHKLIGRYGDNIYHLDHIYSVAEGFKYNVPIELMSALENLQLLPYKDTISKGSKLLGEIPANIKQYLKEYAWQIKAFT